LVEQEPSFTPGESAAFCHSCAAPVSEGVRLCERCSAAEGETEQAAATPTLEEVLNELPARSLVTPVLIILNVLVFAGMVGSGVSAFDPSIESLLQWGANFGPLTLSGGWWRLITCTFIHIGVLHLAVNMYVLWDAGRVVERLVGRAGFLVLYLASGLLGSEASVVWNPLIVSAGASGSVFGVYGALIGIVLRQRESIPMGPLRELRNSALAFLAYNFFYSIGEEEIDVAAHVGGLAGGFVMGLLLSQPPRRESLATRYRHTAAALAAGAALVLVVLAAVPERMMRFAEALKEFNEVETEALGTVNEALERATRGELSHAEIAAILESEVLPQWYPARATLEGVDLEGASEPLRQLRDDLVRYACEREEEWTEALLIGALEELDEVETAVLGRFNEALDRARAGELTDAEFARIIEADMLPTWRSARERLDRIDDDKLVEKARQVCDAAGEYARTREAAFVVMSQALREGDLAKMNRGFGLMQDADRMLAEAPEGASLRKPGATSTPTPNTAPPAN
jgi:membrane associated rhomboid family serine protease